MIVFMVPVDAGSCSIGFLDLCDVKYVENCITVAKNCLFSCSVLN